MIGLLVSHPLLGSREGSARWRIYGMGVRGNSLDSCTPLRIKADMTARPGGKGAAFWLARYCLFPHELVRFIESLRGQPHELVCFIESLTGQRG